MADPVPPPEPSSYDSTPPRARTAEVLRESRKLIFGFADLKPEQIMVLACAASMSFICAVLGFVMWNEREKDLQDRRERTDNAAVITREQNAQNELMRQHCERESASLRLYFADREKERHRFDADREERRTRFEAEQSDKWRTTITASLADYQKWRELLGPHLRKLIPEEEQNDLFLPFAPLPQRLPNGDGAILNDHVVVNPQCTANAITNRTTALSHEGHRGPQGNEQLIAENEHERGRNLSVVGPHMNFIPVNQILSRLKEDTDTNIRVPGCCGVVPNEVRPPDIFRRW